MFFCIFVRRSVSHITSILAFNLFVLTSEFASCKWSIFVRAHQSQQPILWSNSSAAKFWSPSKVKNVDKETSQHPCQVMFLLPSDLLSLWIDQAFKSRSSVTTWAGIKVVLIISIVIFSFQANDEVLDVNIDLQNPKVTKIVRPSMRWYISLFSSLRWPMIRT